jgi:hypothetical protein
MIVEATGPAGAAVSFSATAVDSDGVSLTATCTPASGTPFAIAATNVTCSATDGGGLTSSASFTVTVRDTLPPALSLPGDVTTQSTEAGGAVVTFAVAGTDAVDGATAVDCVPSSGTLFPVATTIVTCSSSDTRGNTSAGTFDVTVQPASPACLPPPAGLAAWWTGDGTASDRAGARPGVLHGGVSYGPGVNGQALVFDGTTGYVEVPTVVDDDLYPQYGSFTLSAWVKTTSTDGLLTIASKDECGGDCPPGSQSLYALFLDQGIPSVKLQNADGDGTGNLFPRVVASRFVADGRYHHVVFVREAFPNVPGYVQDFSLLSLYVDGELDTLSLDGRPYFVGSIRDDNGLSDPLAIGAWSAGGQPGGFFNGSIDDLTLYRRALTPAELRGMYIQRTAGQCHGTDNQAPVLAAPPDQSSREGDAIVPLALAANDPDGDTLGYSASGLPSGLAIDIATGIISGTLDTPGSGSFSVTVAATDGSLSDSKTFTWSVASSNRAPTLVNPGAQASLEGTTIALPLQASDLDGDTLTFSATGLPPGLAIDGATGVIAGSLGFQAAGSYAVTVSVGDGAAQATAGFEWTVTDVPCNPIANPDSATTAQDTPVVVLVLDNDISPAACGTPGIQFSGATQPGHGTVALDGKLFTATYTPAAGFSGVDSFTYSITSAAGGTATATVTVIVTHVNHPPTALDDAAMTRADRTIKIHVLANDSDPDGDKLSIASITTAAHGGVAIDSTSKTLRYIPNGNFNGPDHFTYTVTDGHGGSATASVSVTVTPVNDRPTAMQLTATTAEETPVSIGLAGTDPEGDALTFAAGQPQHGSLTGTAPNLVYHPVQNYFGTDSFTYTASDGARASLPATVTITVTPVNDPPYFALVAPDFLSVTEGCGETHVVVSSVRAGPSSNESAQTVTLTATSNHPDVVPNPTISGSGTSRTLTFHCAPNVSSQEAQITVVADDGQTVNNVFSRSFVIRVKPHPRVSPMVVSTCANTPATILLTGYDVDGRDLTLRIVPPGISHGAFMPGRITKTSWTLVYTPDPYYVGTDSFMYTARAGGDVSAPATVTINVQSCRLN